MSSPASSATIDFPFSIIDKEIRKILEQEGVQFQPRVFGPIMELDDYSGDSLELDNPLYCLEVEFEGGILSLRNFEARYGEFYDLENLLIKKGIPFDRTSKMDWERPPERRVFRPGEPAFDRYFPLDHEAYEPVVSVEKILELLAIDDAGEQAASAIRKYLNDLFPTYPPLADWVKEEANHA